MHVQAPGRWPSFSACGKHLLRASDATAPAVKKKKKEDDVKSSWADLNRALLAFGVRGFQVLR